jgi:hypothetical protein
LRTIPLDPATEEEILALDPEHITEKGVREILLRAPAPGILTIHGGIGGNIPVYVRVPVTAHLATDKKTRDWINAYVPTERPELTAVFESSSRNILWAADVWHSVKKYGRFEAQVLIRAKRAMLGDH